MPISLATAPVHYFFIERFNLLVPRHDVHYHILFGKTSLKVTIPDRIKISLTISQCKANIFNTKTCITAKYSFLKIRINLRAKFIILNLYDS